MGFSIIHRFALFLAGLSTLSAIALIPGLVGLSKPTTALLGITTVLSLSTRRAAIRISTKHLWVALFGLMLATSFAFSLTQGLRWEFLNLLVLSYFSVIAFYFLLSVAVASIEDATALVWGVIAGGTFASVSVLVGYGASQFGTTAIEQRTGGLSGDPNYFAMGAAASAMLAVYPLVRSRSLAVRLFLVAAIVIMIAGALSSFSRGGFVALGLASLFLVYRMVRWGHYFVLVPAFMVMLAMPLALPQDVRDRILTMSTSGIQLDASIQNRLAQYDRSIEMFLSNPVLGVGSGRSHLSEAFGGAVSRQDLRAVSERTRHHQVIHNSFLIVLVETGLLGFIPYVVIYLLSWTELSRVARLRRVPEYRQDPKLRSLVWLGAMLQVGFVALTVAGLFLSGARYKPLWMMFGLSTALATLARTYATRPLESPEREPVLDPAIAPQVHG